MFAPCTEPSWYSSSSGQKVLMRIVNFCCLLGNKQFSLFPKLCSSLHPAPLLRTTYMLSRATQACSAVRLQHSLSEPHSLGSLQTCGTPPGASCSETECGGPNCRTDEGQKKCGGPGCGGLVTAAHSAWQKAMDFDRDILSALAEVEQLSKMVIRRSVSVFTVCLLLM